MGECYDVIELDSNRLLNMCDVIYEKEPYKLKILFSSWWLHLVDEDFVSILKNIPQSIENWLDITYWILES